MSDRLYIVFGQAGEYSDWHSWVVAAYADESLARKHAELAGAEARERVAALRGWPFPTNSPVPLVASDVNPFDPTLTDKVFDYRQEIEYTVTPVELRVSVPDVW